MAVRLVDVQGVEFSGKLVVIKGEEVALWSGIMPDKKGGFRGCGKKQVFPRQGVTVNADNPDTEIKNA
ncbi:MAG: hypothetical protein HYU86_13025 [Chloroflexi bacterium]|nr:hypothetical protein [Chloroflexota bacterium]